MFQAYGMPHTWSIPGVGENSPREKRFLNSFFKKGEKRIFFQILFSEKRKKILFSNSFFKKPKKESFFKIFFRKVEKRIFSQILFSEKRKKILFSKIFFQKRLKKEKNYKKIFFPMGFCKIDSENWTYDWSVSYWIVLEVLFMVPKVVFANNEVWPRKSRFYLRNSESLSLKISKVVCDGSKIFLEINI